MQYELWEFRSRSLVATYPSEETALRMVQQLLASGWQPQDLALGVVDSARRSQAGSKPELLTGDALAARAASVSDAAHRSA